MTLSELPAMRNIRQNLGFAFGYNAAGMPRAAGILYPSTGWLLSPIIAAAGMAAGSLSVVGNASRLRRFTPQTVHTNAGDASNGRRAPLSVGGR